MPQHTPKFSVVERVLAYLAAAIIVIAVLSYLTTMIVSLTAGREVLAHGLWQFVTAIAFYGVPAGFVLIMVLLGMVFARRSIAARTAEKQGTTSRRQGRVAGRGERD